MRKTVMTILCLVVGSSALGGCAAVDLAMNEPKAPFAFMHPVGWATIAAVETGILDNPWKKPKRKWSSSGRKYKKRKSTVFRRGVKYERGNLLYHDGAAKQATRFFEQSRRPLRSSRSHNLPPGYASARR